MNCTLHKVYSGCVREMFTGLQMMLKCAEGGLLETQGFVHHETTVEPWKLRNLNEKKIKNSLKEFEMIQSFCQYDEKPSQWCVCV